MQNRQRTNLYKGTKHNLILSNQFNTKCSGYQHSEFLYIVRIDGQATWAVYHEPTGKTITYGHDRMLDAVVIADHLVNSGIDLTFVDAKQLKKKQRKQLLRIADSRPVVVH